MYMIILLQAELARVRIALQFHLVKESIGLPVCRSGV